ncbi:MAG: choice-of-anchor X domain-containing protein [Chloroflexota bacterium]
MKYKSLLSLFFVLLLVFLVGQISAQSNLNTPTSKQLAASPAEFADLALPAAEEHGINSHSAMIPVQLSQMADRSWQWQSELRFDSRDVDSLMVLSPDGAHWDVSMVMPTGQQINLATNKTIAQSQTAVLGMGGTQIGGELYTFSSSLSGKWAFQVEAAGPQAKLPTGENVDGYLLVSSDSPYQLYSNLGSYDLLVGNEITLLSRMYDSSLLADTAVPASVSGVIQSATAELTLPNGQTTSLTLFDDGLHGDGTAGDGVFGAAYTAEIAGNYSAQVTVSGSSPDGVAFVRTSEHIFPILDKTFEFVSGQPRVSWLDENRLEMRLGGRALANASVDNIMASAEVWGTDAAGNAVPVAWIGGRVEPIQRFARVQIPMTLDKGWIDLAGAQAPFELRNVRIQDMNTAVPIAKLDAMPVQIEYAATASPDGIQIASSDLITEEMLMGQRPEASSSPADIQPLASGSGVLMLVHGYCSGLVWPTSDFSNYAVFQDLNQNRTHDQFAQLIDSYGDNFSSFGVVAHSQGGAAALHLYTYYWSGLDDSSGNRLIQSVGTPYQGTSLAGNLALLGQIFGIGCGYNWDLTYDGAALWLANIPSWARSEVHYYTTSFTDKWWRYDYCQWASDLILSDPDDGTTEKWSGQLSGANNRGHKTGWCHTQSMRDPAQYLDGSRNSNMNSNANR